MVENKKIAVIDGNSWLHRAYHAVPPVMKLADGTPTNAVHGFMNMFLSFYDKAQPDAIVCAFDAGIPSFRLEAVQQYKAQRKPMDNELRVQFPIIEELMSSMDIPVVKVEGWEGDDILGTIAKISENLGYESLLITGDKDANQLASKLTKIVNMKKGVSDVVYYGPDEVFEKYGVTVDQFIDYLALMGDSSDNIPGVPGVGPKSAANLLATFNSLEGIYQNLDKLKGKQLENIRDNEESAYISRKAATIYTDVPLDIDLANLIFPSFNKDKVSEVFLKYKMRSALTGVLNLIGEAPEDSDIELSDNTTREASSILNAEVVSNPGEAPISKMPEPEINFENYKEGKDALLLLNQIIDSSSFSVAISKKMDEAPVQTSLFDVYEEEKYKYPLYKNLVLAVSNNNDTVIVESDDAIDCLISIFKSSNSVIVENAKQLFEIVYSPKLYNQTFVRKEELYQANFFDISLAAYLLNSSKSEYTAVDAYTQVFGKMLPTLDANIEDGLKKTDEKYIEKKNNNLKLRLARRAAVSYTLKTYLEDLLHKCNLDKVYFDIEIPLTKVLVDLQYVGTKIDKEKLSLLSNKTATLLDSLKKEILDLAGEDFNIDSPKQLGHILFEVLGLPVKKKTKTGYSTAADVLEELSLIHPLPKKVIEYREYAKLKSTYIDALPAISDKNNLVHTTFHQKKTTTGRLSSSDPNIQNIPTRSEFGNQIRECFVPLNEGEVFLTADYSQIELRVLAHLSQDKGLLEAFNSGEDFHAYTAANVFGVPVNQVSANQRRKAKAVNFGIVYGQQAFGLSQSLGIDMREAKEMIDMYFQTYPGVRSYLDGVIKSATELGYAETMFGRRRYISELNAPNKKFRGFGERTAMNHPMQGSAADIIKIAMILVQKEIMNNNLNTKCMMQVHDELDFSVPESELDQICSLVKRNMESAVKLDVPLVVDIATGSNWAQAK